MTSTAILRKAKEARFNRWLGMLLAVGFAIFCYATWRYDFTEYELIGHFIWDRFALPLAVFILGLWTYGFVRVYTLVGKDKHFGLTVLYNALWVVGVSVPSFFFCLLVMVDTTEILNAELSDGREIKIHGRVTDFRKYHSNRGHGDLWFVEVNDTSLGRLLEVSVDKRYEVGDEFSGVFSVGKWGWLYSK